MTDIIHFVDNARLYDCCVVSGMRTYFLVSQLRFGTLENTCATVLLPLIKYQLTFISMSVDTTLQLHLFNHPMYDGSFFLPSRTSARMPNPSHCQTCSNPLVSVSPVARTAKIHPISFSHELAPFTRLRAVIGCIVHL